MRNYTGTIIGAIAGAVLIHGVFGIGLGALLGYIFYDVPKKRRQRAFDNAARSFNQSSDYNKALVHHTFALMGYIARGAGRINEDHIKTAEHFMQIMGLNEAGRKLAIEAFNQGKSADFNVQSLAYELRSLTRGNLTLISYLLEIQVQMALSDGALEELEHRRLIEVAVLLGISSEAMERIIRQRVNENAFHNEGSEQWYYKEEQNYEHSEQSYNDNKSKNTSSSALIKAYEVLGVNENMTMDEISHAYKKLMLRYHPDRLKSQNLSPELIKLYEEKAKDIQAAYNLIKKHRR